ncbi:PQQ-binding-like beta-propeller repeat protein [Pseudohongiella spirulinae]|uniref:Quinoprotein glucose dehydrogenase n=1 Tax=Pseudohongiella spirulinae TaxID=1249552 RepID=A0A0S2KBK1_9GAMM|nr:PQQ-binding-like beta-propeller repeat protein [Pseudohongiella spirulinae]ALO45593.1 Quinoprotein glucose dehydrogenase [Pseudohongiella spirulinae]
MIRVLLLMLIPLFMSVNAQAQTASVERGATLFQSECARCHVRADIEMRISNDWIGKPASELYQAIMATMPAETPGSLSPDQYLDLTAHVMQMGGVNASVAGLSANELAELTIQQGASGDNGPDYYAWTTMSGGLNANRYAPLEQINASNVQDLQIAWRWKADNFGPRPEGLNVTTPLMVNGVLYATAGTTRNVVAIDAESGQTLWMWRPMEGDRFEDSPRKNSGKGVAYWADGDQEVIFVVTPGYYLAALDAKTGNLLKSFGNDGMLDLMDGMRFSDTRDDRDITLTFPATVVNDVLVVGAAHQVSMRPPHADNVKGDVRGFDARTGKLLWTHRNIPMPGEDGYETWLNDSASRSGNGGVWANISADPELGLVYLPVESGTGDRFGGGRPGTNLFTGSVVAVDYRTGERKWFFQHLRHDIWDYDTPTVPILADLPDGRKVLVQLTKQAFAYVLDRETGEPIWEMEERPVPQTDVPGEWTSPTQPFPTRPPAYDRQGISEKDLVNFTPEIYEQAKEAVKPYRMGPLYQPPSLANAEDGTLGTLSLPGTLGGTNWEGGVYDPETGMLYVASRTEVAVLSLVPGEQFSTTDWIQGPARTPNVDGIPIVQPPWGRITAIDLNKGDIAWQMANADTPERIKNHPLLRGVELDRTGIPTRSGLLVTKSLLFAGEGQGGNPIFRAHDKATGEILAEIDLPASQTGLPMTYVQNGKQYIVMAVSGSGPAEIIALTLPN